VLWVWLWRMVGAVGCFVVPAPKPEPDYRIDPNAKCPGCGAHDGKLLCIGGEKLGEVLIDHTCAVCQARWYEKPLLDDPQGRDLCPSGKSARNLMANGNGSGQIRQLGSLALTQRLQQVLYTPPKNVIQGVSADNWPSAPQPVRSIGRRGSEPVR
jgi:hypothetical protein